MTDAQSESKNAIESTKTGATRLAILFGVAKYSSPSYPVLSVCKKDAEDFRIALDASGRYSSILCMTDDVAAHVAKKRLSEFLLAHQNKGTVDQILFFFSGHGEFDGTDFRYLLSDYDESKKNLTSLSQSELDRQLRTLSPAVCVKIVDACHSGTLYLKSAKSLENHLGKSREEGQFQECYFYFSSLQEQVSRTGTPYSVFTNAVLSCLLQYPSPDIRYLDLASYIQDFFPEGSLQRPTSFLQGPGNQVFLERHPALAKVLAGFFPPSASGPETSTKDSPTAIEPAVPVATSLSSSLEELAAMSCDVTEIVQMLSDLRDAAEKLMLPEDLRSHFTISVDTGKGLSNCPEHKSIAEWVKGRKGQVWATPTYKEVQVGKTIQVKKERTHNRGGGFASLGLLGSNDTEVTWEPRTVYESRNAIDSFTSSFALPYRWLLIKAVFTKPIVPPVHSYVIPLASRSHIHLFSTTLPTTEASPTELEFSNPPKWQHFALAVRSREGIEPFLIVAARQLENVVREELERAFTRFEIG